MNTRIFDSWSIIITMGNEQTKPSLKNLEESAEIEFAVEESKFKKHIDIDPTTSDVSWNFEPTVLPVDTNGYVVGFNWDDTENIKEFFDKHGVVVINNILTEAECKASVGELWDFVERHSPQIDRHHPETWVNWPCLESIGILGNTPVLSMQFFKNRCNQRLYNVYSNLLSSDNLWTNIGRASIIRPTIGVSVIDSSGNTITKNYDEWRTQEKWLHLDMNPLTGAQTTFMYKETNPLNNHGFDAIGLQGTIALDDCGPTDGGFLCVPGFHKTIENYGKHIKLTDAEYAGRIGPDNKQWFFPDTDELYNHAQKVPVRAGAAIIWSSATPHSTFPNYSNHPRLAQYVHMVNKNTCSKYMEPLLTDLTYFPDKFKLTKFNKGLFGL